MLHSPRQACTPQQASQQAGGGGCTPAAGQATWAAAPAVPATELPLQLLPGFNLWLCIGRPALQLVSGMSLGGERTRETERDSIMAL